MADLFSATAELVRALRLAGVRGESRGQSTVVIYIDEDDFRRLHATVSSEKPYRGHVDVKAETVPKQFSINSIIFRGRQWAR